MKNLLLLCDVFPPAFAPRMGYLCKYLPQFGWHPIVLTEYVPQNIYENLAESQDVTYINFYFSKNRFIQRLKYTLVFLADFLFNYKNFVFVRKAKKIVGNREINAVLSSSYRTFPAVAAHKLSQEYKIPFVMDLRDIFEQFPNNEHISKQIENVRLNMFVATMITNKFLHQRNKLLPQANAVTTVSDWHTGYLSRYSNCVELIYNGFDPELFYPQVIKTTKFIISYTGKVESRELKDPTLFFEAVSHLLANRKLDIEQLNIRFYLKDELSKTIISSFVDKYQMNDCVGIFNIVQNTEIPKILNESAVLLLLANTSAGENTPKGIMGTKTFEYLAVEKPILCVRNDEDCLEMTIKAANAGVSASTVEETEQFLLEKYAEWLQNGHTTQSINQGFIQQFSRKRQAEQFAAILDKLS